MTADAAQPIGLTVTQMQSVLAVSRLFAVTSDLESLLPKIARAACSLAQCERASIWLHDPAAHELYTTVSIDAPPLRVPVTKGIVGAAFSSNETVTVDNAYDDPRFNPAADKATGYLTKSLMTVPMVDIDTKPVGVIQAVNKTHGGFTAQDESLLQLLADQAGVAIQRYRLQEIARRIADLQREMQLARGVQQAMLPKTLPSMSPFDLYGWAKAAAATGGDCYDLWQLPDGRLGILLFDASGHGLAPALVVSQARTLVRTLCDGPAPMPSPHDVLMRLHRRMSQDLTPERFITAFLGYLDSNGTLEWESAGHSPILMRTSADAPLKEIEPALPPINLIEDDAPAPPPLQLQAGGMLAVLSDGISEAFNPTTDLFGTERVFQSLEDNRGGSSNAIANALLNSVVHWQQHDQPVDDQTIVIVQRTSPS